MTHGPACRAPGDWRNSISAQQRKAYRNLDQNGIRKGLRAQTPIIQERPEIRGIADRVDQEKNLGNESPDREIQGSTGDRPGRCPQDPEPETDRIRGRARFRIRKGLDSQAEDPMGQLFFP